MSERRTIKPGYGRFTPPQDPLKEVFGSVGRVDLRDYPSASEQLRFRLDVLAASGPYPSDEDVAYDLCFLRARKAAWETYLYAAFACGMFEGTEGQDLRARLTSVDDANFRSGMSECETCWFLAGRMKLPVDPGAPGRDSKNLEMQILLADQIVGVEVKAPFRETPRTPPGRARLVPAGEDSDKIERCLKAANKQFSKGGPNVLVIVPSLPRPLFTRRRPLLHAAYGQSKLTWQVNTRTGEAAGPLTTQFFPEGKFLETKLPGGRSLKPDGFPAYRRVSALLCIEERLVEKGTPSGTSVTWVDHNVLVLHNPYAYHPVSPDIWDEFPQLVPVGNHMEWTDGYEARV